MTPGSIDSSFANALSMANSSMPALAKTKNEAKARATAQDFEGTFLSSMFQSMFTGMDGEGPMGGSKGVGPWRSFLTQEFGKEMARKGGVGIADMVYKSLMAHQEAAPATLTQSAAKAQPVKKQ